MKNTNSQYTNGTTSLYYQPTDNEVTTLRQYFNPYATNTINTINKAVENVISDSVTATQKYPFSISLDKVTNIEMKLEKTFLILSQNKITSNKPIFIESYNDILRIWNIQISPHNVLSTQGNTYVDGYDILDFNNNNIKIQYSYNYTSWDVPNLELIKKISLNGNENELVVGMNLNENMSFGIIGTNKMNMCMANSVFNNLNMHTTNSIFDFNNASCNNFTCIIKGTGRIINLNVILTSDIVVVGSRTLNINKNKDTICKENIYGPAKINWTINDEKE